MLFLRKTKKWAETTCKRVLVNKEVSHFIDILFARRLLRLILTARILSSSLIYKESRLVWLVMWIRSILDYKSARQSVTPGVEITVNER